MRKRRLGFLHLIRQQLRWWFPRLSTRIDRRFM